MRTWILFAAFAFISNHLLSQKPSIRLSDLDTWPSLISPQISPDGQYALYSEFRDNDLSRRPLVVKSTNLQWEMEIPNGMNPQFTFDSRKLIFSLPGDSLGILELGTDRIDYISAVRNYQLSKDNAVVWVAYIKNDTAKSLILRNEITREEKHFEHIENYNFSDNGEALALHQVDSFNGSIVHSIIYVNLTAGTNKTIWTKEFSDSVKFDNIVFNQKGDQAAFCVRENRNGGVYSLIYYYGQLLKDQAFPIYGDSNLQEKKRLRIKDIYQFNEKGDLLFIHLSNVEKPACSKKNIAGVDVWDYRDDKLQAEQLKEVNGRQTYLARIDLSDGQLLQLTNDNESPQYYPTFVGDRFVALRAKSRNVSDEEADWNPNYQLTIFLVNVYTGARKLVWHPPLGINGGILSPSGHFFIYYDGSKHAYFSYNVLSGAIVNLTADIHTDWSDFGNDHADAKYLSEGIGGWLDSGKCILIYDQWDIWMIDIEGKKAPLDITNGYGRRHGIKFTLPVEFGINYINSSDTLILKAFSRINKKSGFFTKIPLQSGDPQLLSFGDYAFGYFSGISFMKAKFANVYIITRESCSEFPNYYLTYDFKSFTAISQLQPQKKFNWMTSKLVKWKAFDGLDCQGILYLPEDFNAAKKYPVIVHYYEQRSDGLNHFLYPMLASSEINIPWFVSNEYIVFIPDIHYKLGYPGVSAYNCIVSGAEMLASKKWIDKTRMGLDGHSFGGYETDYVITHSKMFAAAISTSGICDLLREYFSLWPNGTSKQEHYEMSQIRMKYSLWQRRDLYILNSPIFNADRVQTPLLMMNNKADAGVLFSDGVEFFTALRRLGKKVWMLQYDNEGHSLTNNKNKADYSMRMMQFFDYFLNKAAAPEWLLRGIPAAEKGCTDGLQIIASNNGGL